MAITITSISDVLLNYDRTETAMKEQTTSAELKKNRIGEYKRLTCEYSSSLPLNNLQIFFSPALFIDSAAPNPFIPGQPGNNYWSYTVDAAATVGVYDMFLNVSAGYNSDLIKNHKVQIEIISDTSFLIIFFFYHVSDVNSFLNPAYEENRMKLFKDRFANPLFLTEAGSSIYTSSKFKPRMYVYVKSADGLNYGYNDHSIANYEAGFYAKNELGADPYFTDPAFTLSNPLSTAANVALTFSVTAPAAVTDIQLWMIRADKADQSVDLLENYDASFIRLFTTFGTATIHNKFKSPSFAPALITGTTYGATVTIDRTKLNAGEKYRFIGIAYRNVGETYEVNSFISDEYIVGLESYAGAFDPAGSISDYNREFTGNQLVCVVEERLKSRMKFDLSGFAYDIFTRLGLVVANDIRRYMDKITIDIYEDIGTTRHYFDRLVCNRTAPNMYSSASGLSLNFTDPENPIFEYDFRVRYESGILNLQSMIGLVTLPMPTANQNWAGRDLRIEWMFELYYDDYSTPFFDQIIFKQKLAPKDYDNSGTLLLLVDDGTGKDGEGSPISNSFYFCNTEQKCFNAVIEESDDTFNLITTVEKEPGTIAAIDENEVYAPLVLVQKTSNKFSSQEATYGQTDGNIAHFCLDGSKFFVDSPYKLSVMAKKAVSALQKKFEDGEFFEFEDGDDYEFEN